MKLYLYIRLSSADDDLKYKDVFMAWMMAVYGRLKSEPNYKG